MQMICDVKKILCFVSGGQTGLKTVSQTSLHSLPRGVSPADGCHLTEAVSTVKQAGPRRACRRLQGNLQAAQRGQ